VEINEVLFRVFLGIYQAAYREDEVSINPFSKIFICSDDEHESLSIKDR